MTSRTKRRLLTLLAGFFLACSGGVVWLPYSPWWALSSSSLGAKPVTEKRDLPNSNLKTPDRQLVAQDFEVYWKRPLRGPLYDPPPAPPPPPKVVEVPPPRPIVARLLATMVEPGNSMAMLQLSTGEVVFRKLDEDIGAADAGAKISLIEEGTVSVAREKEVTKLVVAGQKVN